jgi:hypothetical protein
VYGSNCPNHGQAMGWTNPGGTPADPFSIYRSRTLIACGGPVMIDNYQRGVNAKESDGLAGQMLLMTNFGKYQWDKYKALP